MLIRSWYTPSFHFFIFVFQGKKKKREKEHNVGVFLLIYIELGRDNNTKSNNGNICFPGRFPGVDMQIKEKRTLTVYRFIKRKTSGAAIGLPDKESNLQDKTQKCQQRQEISMRSFIFTGVDIIWYCFWPPLQLFLGTCSRWEGGLECIYFCCFLLYVFF